MVSISFAITTHNEGQYIKVLLDKLVKNVTENDEIVVLDDYSDDPATINILESFKDKIKFHQRKFEGNFAEHKNHLLSLCTKDFVVFIDADEVPHDILLHVIRETLFMNPSVELFAMPRINIVSGLTEEHIQRWGWKVNEKQYVNFPDLQWRICRRKPEIKWQGKVHERLVGSEKHSALPYWFDGEIYEGYCLLHFKTIDRQEKQNELYATL